MKEPILPNDQTWAEFWEEEAKRVKEKGPVPYGGGCGRWWCCGTWWGIESMRGSERTESRKKEEMDFGQFLANFKARHADAYKVAAPQVLEAARPRSVAMAVAVEAPKDFKVAAGEGDDWDGVED